jgi:hypothetical protein
MIIPINQGAKVSAIISSCAFSSWGMKEHGNVFGQLEGQPTSAHLLKKGSDVYLTREPVNL